MKFERVSKYPEAILPERATTGSAGYDFASAEDITVKPHEIALVPTGIKCKLCSNSWLMLALRSSTPRKKHLMLANGIGIIDSDYYNNPDNEGHIMFQVYNFSDEVVTIAKGERIGQGVILPFETVYNDKAIGERVGGFGSTSAAAPVVNDQIIGQMMMDEVMHGNENPNLLNAQDIYEQINKTVLRSAT